MYLVADDSLWSLDNPPIKKNISLKKIVKEKTKFCNFIYSQDIPERNKFFSMINSYKKVDSPGRCMNNMAPIGFNDPKKSRASKNWVKEKLKFLKPYKFTIAFENFISSGWSTEKIIHPMMANSIPIYMGHKDIEKEFNTKSFVNINDFNSIDDFIEHIKKVDSDTQLYLKYLKEPWLKGNKINKYYNKKKLFKIFNRIFD